MRLAQFIRTHPGDIEAGWEKFAGAISVFAPDLSVESLRDHLREISVAIADDMESPQSAEEQSEKSEGKQIRGGALDRISALHARTRLDSGFNLEQAISEYRALRSSVLFLWVRSQPSDDEVNLSEVTRFNETIDQAIAEVVRRFADRSEHYGDVFPGILTHEVRNPFTIIGLSGQILKAGPLQEGQSRSVERIRRGVERIDRLMDDLSVLVRSRMRVPFQLKRTNADLDEICEQTFWEVKASHSDAVFGLEKSGDLKRDWDRERLGQIVFNLVIA
jgi:signal transduction histidine kinase